MNINTIRQLIDTVERSSLFSFSYEDKDIKISLTRNSPPIPVAYTPPAPVAETEPEAVAAENLMTVTSPVVGTVYRAREPGGTPLVSVGDTVIGGDPLCVIEAMKFFSDVVAPCAGTVVEISFKDGTLAEFGAPLVVIEVEI